MRKLNILKSLFFLLVFLFSNAGFAQSTPAKNTGDFRPTNIVNLNLLGEASLVSINYEKLFLVKPRFFFAGQFGMGYNEEFIIFGNDSSPDIYFTIPHHVTCNLGKKKHFFEIGLSGAVVSGNTNNNYLLGPIIGYRLQPLNSNKFNLRIFGSIPIVGFSTDIVYVPVGISAGICFD